jgi:hypothetical protein
MIPHVPFVEKLERDRIVTPQLHEVEIPPSEIDRGERSRDAQREPCDLRLAIGGLLACSYWRGYEGSQPLP